MSQACKNKRLLFFTLFINTTFTVMIYCHKVHSSLLVSHLLLVYIIHIIITNANNFSSADLDRKGGGAFNFKLFKGDFATFLVLVGGGFS